MDSSRLWDSSRESGRGGGGGRFRRGRGGGGYRGDGYRGRGRGGYSHYSGPAELWDSRDHAAYRSAEPEHQEPVTPATPVRIQIKTRKQPASNAGEVPSAATASPLGTAGNHVQNGRPVRSAGRGAAEAREKTGRGGINHRRPLLHVDSQPQSRAPARPVPANHQRKPKMKWLCQEENLPCQKMLDENLEWNEHAKDVLQSQSNFLVVGVLGKQSVGKSTVMSLLAGTRPEQILTKAKPFPVASTAALEVASNQTSGVDITVTTERLILLDTQPLLSTSILDRFLLHERHSAEPHAMKQYRLQSYQIATLLHQICHVLVVVEDPSLSDPVASHYLRMVDLLKPRLGSHVSSGTAHSHLSGARAPHVIVVYNKATPDAFLASNVKAIHAISEQKFRHVSVRFHSGMSLLQSGLVVCEERQRSGPASNVNVFLLPPATSTSVHGQSSAKVTRGCLTSVLTAPAYHSHPSFAATSSALVRQILSIRPHRLTPSSSPMSELQWFVFAGRMWDAIRKNSLFLDLECLLCD